MVRLEKAIVISRDTQTSNANLYRKDLGRVGCYSALDIGIRMQNGATSAINLDPLDVISRISLVVNGNDYRFHLKGQDMYRLYWLKNKRPMPATFSEVGAAVQEVWFRMEFGRFLGDPQFGLDLSKFSNVQVQIDYALTTWGAVGVTTFTTGTFAPTIIAHQFPALAKPNFRGMLGQREFWNGTSVASGEEVQDLPSNNMVIAAAVSCLSDGVADASTITDVRIGKDRFTTLYAGCKWYNEQPIQNYDLAVKEEHFDLFVATAQVKDTHLSNIRSATCTPRVHTVPT